MQHRGSRNSLKRKRRSAFKKQGGICFWCGDPMFRAEEAPPHHGKRETSEHLIPLSKGGAKGPIVAACLDCNQARKNCDLETWLHRVRFRLKQSSKLTHFEVILSWIASFGISTSIGQPLTGPDSQQTPTVPPRTD